MVVGIELEEEVSEVDKDEYNGCTTAELEEIGCFKGTVYSAVQPFVLEKRSGTGLRSRVSGNSTHERRRDDQSDNGDCHQRGIQLGGHGLEFLGTEPEPADWGRRRCEGQYKR